MCIAIRAKSDCLSYCSLGCRCEDSELGCCPDGKTTKPKDGNCTCDSTTYGCCLDGVTEAKGDKFEECPTKPRRPGGEFS